MAETGQIKKPTQANEDIYDKSGYLGVVPLVKASLEVIGANSILAMVPEIGSKIMTELPVQVSKNFDMQVKGWNGQCPLSLFKMILNMVTLQAKILESI